PNSSNVAPAEQHTDHHVDAVLVAGAKAPEVVTEPMVKTMKAGAMIVDVAVDQGGCVETTRPTSLLEPVWEHHGVVHYGVTNMPALVSRTSTFALTNATLPYALELARAGVRAAVRANGELGRGVNVWEGRVVHPAVAAAVGVTPTPLVELAGAVSTR